MDQKKARKLEQELVKAIGEIVCRLGLRRLPLLPSHNTMQDGQTQGKRTFGIWRMTDGL